MDWKPHPQQEKALRSRCFETLYGGARGGGKTDAGFANCLYDIDNPRLRQLVIRRNYDDLKDWIDRARSFFSRNKAVFIDSRKEIQFPSGSKILLGHLKDESAYTKYQGHEYQRQLVEELTHIPSEELYLKLTSSCRSTVPGLDPRIFATTNPGEVGHRWVKKRFVDPAPPETVFKDPVTGRTRIFIPARVDDNPTLMKNDPDYVRFLEGLPDGLRQQWREGSWEDVTIKGAYYSRQIREARDEQRICRLPMDHDIPRKFFFDIGISKSDSMAVWCTQEYGKEIRAINCWEFFEESLTSVLAFLFRTKEAEYVERMYFPHDIRVRETSDGETRLETVLRLCRKRKVEVSVVPAMNPEERVHMTRLIFRRIFINKDACEDGIEAIKNYRKEWDEKLQTFKNTPLHDWSCFDRNTIVLTRLGKKKIMELPQNGEILTPFGWKKYTNPRITGRNAPLVEVKYRDGTKVRCTPEHLFLTASGWKSAESLMSCSETLSSLTPLRSISMVGCVGFGRVRSILQGAAKDYIGRFGRRLLERYHQVVTSTTKIRTRLITLSKTLSAYLLQSIYQIVGAKTQLYTKQEREASKMRGKKLKSGTNQKKVVCGTRETQRDQRVGSNGKEKKESVSTVEKTLLASFGRTDTSKSTAVPTVSTLTIESVKKLKERADVWDITVPSVHCFSLENGAIVHNSHYSDAFGMIGVTQATEFPVEETQGETLRKQISRDLGTSPEDREESNNPFGF